VAAGGAEPYSHTEYLTMLRYLRGVARNRSWTGPNAAGWLGKRQSLRPRRR